MHVRQSKGKRHIKFIRLKAMRIWKASKYKRGLYGECLKTALENHRLRVEKEISDKKYKSIREQLTFSCCDQNGWMG
jgi:hypothetical protein